MSPLAHIKNYLAEGNLDAAARFMVGCYMSSCVVTGTYINCWSEIVRFNVNG